MVIVGAGLSGLVAAYELVRAGNDVTVLEARDVSGGRARTIRSPFVDGQFAEAGPARIRGGDDLTIAYCTEFNLPRDPFYPPAGSLFIDNNGPRDTNPITTQYYTKIRGGTQLFPQAFADRLVDRIRYSSPVTQIAHTDTGVTVTTGGTGGEPPITADRVLVTVPFPVMDRINFAPNLSVTKRQIIANLEYTPVTRSFIQFSRRYWADAGLNGFGRVSWEATNNEEIWQPTWDASGTRGILLSYVRSDKAVSLGEMSETNRIAALLAHWEGIFPGVATYKEASTSIVWQNDEWTGGAYAGTSSSQLAGVAAAEGRVHFAGEHASHSPGWMQGALESGLRAAAEIAQAAS